MLEKYPKPEDWDHARFSDKIHFGWGLQGKLRIIRKPGQRYCSDCLQEKDDPTDRKGEKQFHCWAAVGYNFKSDIQFYEVPHRFMLCTREIRSSSGATGFKT